MNAVLVIVAAVVLGFLGLQGYVRFAPTDTARWHVTPMMPDVGTGDWPLPSGTRVARDYEARPEQVLSRLHRIALDTPRTRVLEGRVEDGRITYETRSAFWGFPDYTSVAVRSDGAGTRLEIFARLRFGNSDLGVNAARVSAWLEALGEVAPGS